MAIRNDKAAAGAAKTTTPAIGTGTAGFEKAAAFLNVNVVVKGGAEKQLGGIPLHLSKALHKALIELGPEEVAKLQFTVSMKLVDEAPAIFEFELK